MVPRTNADPIVSDVLDMQQNRSLIPPLIVAATVASAVIMLFIVQNGAAGSATIHLKWIAIAIVLVGFTAAGIVGRIHRMHLKERQQLIEIASSLGFTLEIQKGKASDLLARLPTGDPHLNHKNARVSSLFRVHAGRDPDHGDDESVEKEPEAENEADTAEAPDAQADEAADSLPDSTPSRQNRKRKRKRGKRKRARNRRPHIDIFNHMYMLVLGQFSVPVFHRVAVAPVPKHWPTTRILSRRNSGKAAKSKRKQKIKRIKLESDDFNRRYHVETADEGFAIILINPDLQQILAHEELTPKASSQAWHIEKGRLWYTEKGHLSAVTFPKMMDRLNDVLTTIDPALWPASKSSSPDTEE